MTRGPESTADPDTPWRRRIQAEIELRGLVRDGRPLAETDFEPGVAGELPPSEQFRRVERAASCEGCSRIPVPGNVQQLWSQHKYSVLARDQRRYREVGPVVARGGIDFDAFGIELIEWLATPPTATGLRNALQHMWGHVSHWRPPSAGAANNWPSTRLAAEIRWRAIAGADDYVRRSTALGELGAWL